MYNSLFREHYDRSVIDQSPKELESLRLLVWKPLSCKSRPFKRGAEHQVVEEGRILLPGLVLFIYNFLLHLFVFLLFFQVHYTSNRWSAIKQVPKDFGAQTLVIVVVFLHLWQTSRVSRLIRWSWKFGISKLHCSSAVHTSKKSSNVVLAGLHLRQKRRVLEIACWCR